MKPSADIWMWITHFWEIAQTKYGIPLHSNFKLSDRTWPDKDIDKAPRWVSVDLRDGNQSLENPMTVEQKLEHFQILVEMWFKEIEVWFPSASQEDFDFVRKLIEEDLIPDDVTIQVLVQSKKDLIDRTRASLEWAKNAIVHLYNSTSATQRKVVFWHTQKQTTDLALEGVRHIKNAFWDFAGNLTFQYSPESFTGTEIEFARDICTAVIDEWGWFTWKEIIINLPATVENTTPDRYADKIEWMVRELKQKTSDLVDVIVSLHTHNDRWTGIAATELWIKAGAQRVEGTLFGNGERAGNVPIEILALNMLSQWIPPWLNLSHIGDIARRVNAITWMSIHPRHPYLGELVHTAFSWSHQDAINKWFAFQKGNSIWDNPYLPIDPADLGLIYMPIRINSQSWKWGVAFILQRNWYEIPKAMQPYVWRVIQWVTEVKKWELTVEEIVQVFEINFVNVTGDIDINWFQPILKKWSNEWELEQFSEYVKQKYGIEFQIVNYSEFSRSVGTSSEAITYMEIMVSWKKFFWVWVDRDFAMSAFKALISGLNISKK